MAECVVDRLEPVQVNGDHTNHLVGSRGLMQQVRQPVSVVAAVVEPRETVQVGDLVCDPNEIDGNRRQDQFAGKYQRIADHRPECPWKQHYLVRDIQEPADLEQEQAKQQQGHGRHGGAHHGGCGKYGECSDGREAFEHNVRVVYGRNPLACGENDGQQREADSQVAGDVGDDEFAWGRTECRTRLVFS